VLWLSIPLWCSSRSCRTADAGRDDRRGAIIQQYVDHLVPAGWGYYGVYQVDGLVPGAFGEILADGDDLDDALRRDKKNDFRPAGGNRAFYRECRGMFWTRGSTGKIWRAMDEPPPLPS